MRFSMNPNHAVLSAALCSFVVVAPGCGPEGGGIQVPNEKVEQEEKIDSENNPDRFQLRFERSYATLPTSGTSTRKPFPSNWWPMSRAGIAQDWMSNRASPAHKYDQLVSPDRIRDVKLTLAKKDWEGKPVNEGAQPETFHIGPASEWELKHHGRYGEVDPENWWGHCNGWASYVLNEDEPTRAVSVRYDARTRRVSECANANEAGCVRFELGDINALGAEIYWSDGARMVSRRCETEGSKLEFDEAGRIKETACRDGNAATMHLIATNMLGRLQRPFVVDLTADRQVWNYPIYRFELTQNREVTLEEALRLVEAPAGTTSWIYDPSATRFIQVGLTAWVVEDAIPPSTEPAGPLLERYTTLETYEYLLELDARGDIIGGEWLGASKRNHPDFFWYSYSNSPYDVSSDDLMDQDNTAIRYSVFKQILTLAQLPPGGGGGEVAHFEVTPNVNIPDNNSAGVAASIEVGENFSVARLTVNVEITHTYRGDLKVVLKHDGREEVLHDRSGGGRDNLSLAVDASTFVGQSSRGTWTLVVSDHAGSDVGKLVSFALDMTRGSGGGGGGGGGGSTVDRTYEARPEAAIPDNNATGVSSAIDVPDSITTTKVRIRVDISHSYRGDLRVVVKKGNKSAVLHDGAGGSANDLRETFEVADMVGIDAKGTWQLQVVDNAGDDVGTLHSWAVLVTGTTGGGGGGGGGGGTTVTRELSTQPNLAIPDDDANGIQSSIQMTERIRVATLKVTVAIAHPYAGDLVVSIEKDGVVETLQDRQGGSANDIRRVFETQAFRNGDAKGTFILRVKDIAGGDIGTLESWGVTISGTSL